MGVFGRESAIQQSDDGNGCSFCCSETVCRTNSPCPVSVSTIADERGFASLSAALCVNAHTPAVPLGCSALVRLRLASSERSTHTTISTACGAPTLECLVVPFHRLMQWVRSRKCFYKSGQSHSSISVFFLTRCSPNITVNLCPHTLIDRKRHFTSQTLNLILSGISQPFTSVAQPLLVHVQQCLSSDVFAAAALKKCPSFCSNQHRGDWQHIENP